MLVAACGSNSAVNVAHPLYVVVDGQQHLYLEVLSAGHSGVADRIDLGTVGRTPPAAGVALGRGGNVIVTNTAAIEGRAIMVQAATLICRKESDRCSQLVTKAGSDAVYRAGPTFVVPLYSGNDMRHGKVAVLDPGPPPHVDRTVALPPGWYPGPMAMSPDGHHLYWLTAWPPADPTSPANYVLLEYDLTGERTIHQVSFGSRLPGAIGVGADGVVYVAITYANLGSKSPPVAPTPGKSVEIFGPDLTYRGAISVGEAPVRLCVGGLEGDSLAVMYQGSQGGFSHVDLISTASKRVTRTVHLPDASPTVAFLSTLGGGDFAIVLAAPGGQFTLGLVPPAGGSMTWHTYPGNPDSGVAG
ncbi:MAG: hypothetical protein ACREPA_05185 [Candidatus Dormibacteraceae bacterium]